MAHRIRITQINTFQKLRKLTQILYQIASTDYFSLFLAVWANQGNHFVFRRYSYIVYPTSRQVFMVSG